MIDRPPISTDNAWTWSMPLKGVRQSTGFQPPVPYDHHMRQIATAPVDALSRSAPPLAGGLALAAAAVGVGAVDPAAGRVPLVPCLFHAVSGWSCPLCGLTRGTNHLLHGDLGAALAMHPLTPVVVAAVIVVWATWLWARVSATSLASAVTVRPVLAVLRSRVTWAALAVFTVVRNLPAMDALRP